MADPPISDDSTKDLASAVAAAAQEPRLHEQILLQALTRLPERCRDVILWYHREQQSYEDIAARLNLTPEAARQLHREAVALAARELHQQSEP